MSLIVVCRTIAFSAGIPSELSAKGRGINFTLEVYLEGKKNLHSGLVTNLTDVKEMLTQIIERLDHKHLGFEMPNQKEFSYPNLLEWIYTELANRLSADVSVKELILFVGDEGSLSYGQGFKSIPVSSPPFTSGKLF